ncbi:MAG TPA: hypothetical protein VJ876_07845 [Bacteroidales bacterium]|nr:hypothetical protein [Bacteroidales bacterium]
MKGRDFIIAIIGFIFIAPVFFTSCEEESSGTSTTDTIVSVDTIYSSDTIFSVDTIFSSDTVYLAGQNVFMLEFQTDPDPDYNTMNVSFAMNANNISEIPDIEVNGTQMQNFYTQGMILYGNMEIPYGKSVQYSVSKGDSVTDGSLIMPEIVEGSVNDSSLFGASALSIPEAASFDLYYEFTDMDYTRIEKRDDHPWLSEQTMNITANTYTLSIDTIDVEKNYSGNYEADLYHLNFSTAKGIGPYSSGAGLTPNVSGEFGSGYVSATERHSPTWVYMDPALKSSDREEPAKSREEDQGRMKPDEFINAYKQMIKNSHLAR